MHQGTSSGGTGGHGTWVVGSSGIDIASGKGVFGLTCTLLLLLVERAVLLLLVGLALALHVGVGTVPRTRPVPRTVPGVVVLRAGRERGPALRGRVHVQVRMHIRRVGGRVGSSEAGSAVALLAGLVGAARRRRVVVVVASVLWVRRRLVHRVERHGAAGQRRLGAH